jgi:hypothetical protein
VDPLSTKQRVQRRVAALEQERSSWLAHWQDINRVLLPRTGQFFGERTNNGARRNQDILDNTATKALGTLAAGMQSGLTSPARPWFKLETQDADLMNVKAVSTWLDIVSQKLLSIFARSNTYRSLHGMYEELGAYGCAGSVVLPDFKDVIRFYPLTIGEFCIATNDRGEVDTLSRGFQMTVHQIVGKYVAGQGGAMDWSKVTTTVKNMWEQHRQDAWVPVSHLVQPRTGRNTQRMDAKNMPFESVLIEAGANDDRVLNESGYRRFPALVPRWAISGHDIYGSNCPGMTALGDILQLQHEQLRKGQGIDYQTMPPLQAPMSLKNQDSDVLPGGLTYVDQVGPNNAIRTAFDVNLNMQHLLMDIQDVRQRINGAFFSDLFLFLSSMDASMRGGKMTAREVAEIHEEKLLMLGPVVENVGSELQSPLVDIAFDAGMEAGIFPPPPPELAQIGAELKVEFIGVLAQAQRSVSMSSVDRWIGAVASIAAAKQDQSVWDNVNTDKVISKAGGYLGIDPELENGADEVAQIREGRAQLMAAQQKQEQAAQAAETAKNLAAAPVNTNNALGQLVQGFAGSPA